MKLLYTTLVGLCTSTSIHCNTEPGHHLTELIVQTHMYENSESALFHRLFNNHLCLENTSLHSVKLSLESDKPKRTDYL